MAKVRGNMINLTGALMTVYPDAQEKADSALYNACGKHWRELTVDDFIDTKMWDLFMKTYEAASPQGESALLTLGKRIYPKIKSLGQIPTDINTPLKMLRFEGEGFKMYHQGQDAVSRMFLKSSEGEVIVDAPSPGYDCKVIEGVYMGILEIFGKVGKVEQTKCVKKGDSTCLYHITWQ